MIEVSHLVKEFTITEKEKGLLGSMKAMVRPKKKVVRAVDDISFHVDAGEIVGFLGPNGAGKSTTVKMLSGILQPTSGTVRIHSLSPSKDRKRVVQDLGVVFGQRSQLFWDLRLGESFELLRRMYRVSDEQYEKSMALMNEVLSVGELMNTPVRQLSLGQRMRGDIAAAMLHQPSLLFLDEPTIGLDVQAKDAIRTYIRKINELSGVTVILTTHDLDDVQSLCRRIIVINHGRLMEDGSIDSLIHKIAPYRYVVAELEQPADHLTCPGAEVVKWEGNRVWLRFDREKSSGAEVIKAVTARYAVRDVAMEEATIEDVIRKLYETD